MKSDMASEMEINVRMIFGIFEWVPEPKEFQLRASEDTKLNEINGK